MEETIKWVMNYVCYMRVLMFYARLIVIQHKTV